MSATQNEPLTAALVDAETPDAAEVLAEVEAIDVGQLARDEDERLLHRYCRRRQQLTAEITRVKEQTAAMLRDLERQVESLDWCLRGRVEEITRSRLTGRTRSVKTPWGTVGFRKHPTGIEVADEAAVIEAVLSGDLPNDVTRTKVEVSKSALNEVFRSTGEVPPGCDLVPERDDFYVK